MSDPNNICLACLSDSRILKTVFHNETENEIFTYVKYALPELKILDPEFPVYICPSCHTTLLSFYMFKKKCLENYTHLKSYKPQRTSDTYQNQSLYDSQITRNTNKQFTEQEQEIEDIELNIKQENEDIILSSDEQDVHRVQNSVYIKEELVETEDAGDIEVQHLEFVKCEPVPEVEDGSSSSKQDNNPLDRTQTNSQAETKGKLIPKKSADRYIKEFRVFLAWKKQNQVTDVTEEVILAYMLDLSKKLCSASLWAKYSMVKSMLLVNENLDISRFSKVIAFLKKESVSYRPTQSKTLTRDEVHRFMREAPDDQYLLTKIIAMMGIAGGCRREELHAMSREDVIDTGSQLVVTIPHMNANQKRVFTVVNEVNESNFLDLYRKYCELRPKQLTCNKLFVGYRNGKCSSQTVGIHAIGGTPKKIATYLNLENPEKYTGHCFRRTSTTFRANVNPDLTVLKRLEEWKTYRGLNRRKTE